MFERAIFLAVFLFSYTLQAITGFAGNILCMPVGTQFLGLAPSVTILNITGCLSCTLLAVVHREHINWRELGKIVAVMVPFICLGIWLDMVIPLNILLKIYGAIVLAVGLKNLVQKHQDFLPDWALWIVLMLAGLIQGMFVSGGAFLVIYVVQKLRDKEQFRATLTAIWAILNFAYAVFQVSQGHFTGEVGWIVLACIPLILLGTFLGGKLSKHVSQKNFLTLTYILLVVIGIILLVTG